MIEAWVDAVRELGGREPVAAVGADELARRYAEPHRYYHTSTHIDAVLRDADWLAAGLLPAEAPAAGPADRRARAELRLAICAHDVVYDARPGQDERSSAEWAGTQLTRAGIGDGSIRRVQALVLATLDHRADDDDGTAAVLLDADLAILAAPRPAYTRYARAVRREYAAVPDDQWRAGRAQVLTDLLARDRLYRTDRGRRQWQAAARANLRRELDELAGPA